ncbi:MAG: hypothetical protein U1E73_04360 [Planctomycetota bacterium]
MPPRDRVFTLPLVGFLGAVAVVLVASLLVRGRTPSPAAAVALLSDGDGDGEERARVLQVLVDQGLTAPSRRLQWAGMLAAIALGDAAQSDAIATRIGSPWVAGNQPEPGERAGLDLGDDRIANLARGYWAEGAGDRPAARRAWQQVAAECQLAPLPVAARLAGEALTRLP